MSYHIIKFCVYYSMIILSNRNHNIKMSFILFMYKSCRWLIKFIVLHATEKKFIYNNVNCVTINLLYVECSFNPNVACLRFRVIIWKISKICKATLINSLNSFYLYQNRQHVGESQFIIMLL